MAVIGLAFKPGTDDLRRSPALEVIDGLRVAGAAVRGYDPIVVAAEGVDVTGSVEEALAGADAAIVVSPPADAGSWDWPRLCDSMRRSLVIDGRGTLAGLDWPPAVRYLTVGRVNA